MRRPTQFSAKRLLRFNITPLIDVVFLLIIFFLVASHFVRVENAEPVELPLASAANPDVEPTHRLTVSVRDDGILFISGKPVTEQTAMQRIARLASSAAEENSPPELRIRADRSGLWAPVRRLIEECARHNIRTIQFAVTKEDA